MTNISICLVGGPTQNQSHPLHSTCSIMRLKSRILSNCMQVIRSSMEWMILAKFGSQQGSRNRTAPKLAFQLKPIKIIKPQKALTNQFAQMRCAEDKQRSLSCILRRTFASLKLNIFMGQRKKSIRFCTVKVEKMKLTLTDIKNNMTV